MIFNLPFTISILPMLLRGLAVTLYLVVASLLIGTVIGVIGSYGKLVARGALAKLAKVYVSVFRGLPEPVIIFWIYFCGPLVFSFRLSATGTGILALSLVAGAYLTEIFRAGIQGVPHGQFEAARALGLSPMQLTRHVIAPQAVRLMLPTCIGLVTIVMKNSALVSAVGAEELFYRASVIAGDTFRYLEAYTAVGIMYFLTIVPFSILASHCERALRGAGQ